MGVRRAVVSAGLVAVVALLWALLPQKAANRTAPSPATGPLKPAPTATGGSPAEPEAAPPEAEAAPGTVSGTLRYEDGTPAVGGKLTMHSGDVEVDATGAFRFDNVRPGYQSIFLVRQLELREFWLDPGEERRFDLVIARGGTLRGRVVAAEERLPLNCAVDLVTREGRIIYRDGTRGGSFDFGWVPGGGYYVVAHGHYARWNPAKLDASAGKVAPEPEDGEFDLRNRDLEVAKPGFQTTVVACDVDRPDVALEIALPHSRSIDVRFENLPPEWAGRGDVEIRYVIQWRDRRGLDFTLPPSNAIGWSFGGPFGTALDERGAASLRAPPPGVYTMSFVDPYGRVPAWLEQEVTIPEGSLPDPVIRLPDGARVIVSHGGPDGLAIGPVIAYAARASDADRVFARVPAGHHAIWTLGDFCKVRVGEIDVPSGGEIRHEIKPSGTASLYARLESTDGDDPAELRREGDNEVVASEYRPRHWFSFFELEAGRYTLIVKGRRIPIVLAEGQRLDLGVIR